MNATEEAKRIQWTPIFKEEWISKWTYPNQNVKDGEAVTFDGLTYRIHDLGPGGDSDANSIWILEDEPNVAFVGDLVFNGHHPYIADDHIFDWLRNLERARDLTCQYHYNISRPWGIWFIRAYRCTGKISI